MERAYRKMIRKKIEDFRSMNSSELTEEKIISEANEIKKLLDLYNAGESSQLRVDFERILENVLKKLDEISIKEKNKEPEFNKPKRDYFGKAKNLHIGIKTVFDHAFVYESYTGILRVSWRFNEKGRIDLVDSVLFPEKKIMPLIKIEGFDRIARDWVIAPAVGFTLPGRLGRMDYRFDYWQDNTPKYYFLLDYGHNLARILKESIEKNELYDSHYRKGQKHLKEILEDEDAIAIIQRASELKPKIENVKEKKFKVLYEKINFTNQ